MNPDEARRKVIWHDTSDLVVRPNRSSDALELHVRDVLGDEAVMDELGFDASQAPFPDEDLPREVVMALKMAKASPGLIADPGLPQLAAQIKAVLEGDIPELAEPQPVPPGLEGGQPPGPEGEPPTPPPGEGEPEGPERVQVPQTSGKPAGPPPPSAPAPARAASAGGNFAAFIKDAEAAAIEVRP